MSKKSYIENQAIVEELWRQYQKDNNPKWPKLPSWYKQPSDLKKFFTTMCENNISEKVAIKIVGENWFNFMKNQF